MEIKFNILYAQIVLLRLKKLYQLQEALPLQHIEGSGSGNVNSDLEQFVVLTESIHTSLNDLFQSTIAFVLNYSSQLQGMDRHIAAKLSEDAR